MPGWRNGLRRGLKILDSKGFVGSNPTPGTRVWFSGRMRPCQGRDGGSIPPTRTMYAN
ncbi:MAG: hypothetical protein UY32_C0009G0006 [Candidatus Jorgensenbacteria bacterium GW2011_GWC1_48_8]|uniref:Uncharacterized protein n=2 Tax=Candidatus Joergenseniibacteriota TaxID=1752739 RepID=A0A0G1YI37_9BACT|nr:MAG: hypothetical protein UY32_C0009G0006 [Candidatus Jorgensenbacteria bacterium GW2011_GWC1_48_8]KKW14602.1 MAG: hypothetical protein UY55_C0006G0011 [Candidatus Jorgensenbacteria bacterium GW2011_GWB1_50_10]